MNKFLTLALSILLILIVVSCSASDEETKDNKQDNQTDFRQSKWGMGPDEVKLNETTPPISESNELLLYKTDFMDIPAQAGYVFKKSALVKGAYLFEEHYDNPDDYIASYERIKIALIKEYGAPSLDEAKWINDESRDIDEATGKAVCEGEVIYKTEWVEEKSLIKLLLEGANNNCRQGIVFESKGNYMLEHPQSEQSAVTSEEQ